MIDVAEAAGQPRPLVRYFIGNRADMVNALIDRLLERGEAKFRLMSEGGSAGQALDIVLDQIFADDTTNIVIMELWHLSLRDAALRERLGAIYRRVIFEVTALLGDDADPDAAFAAVSLAFGAAFFRHLGLAPQQRGSLRDAAHCLLTPNRILVAGA
ncbi:hypothetical protein [Novosphingobium sp.]|uniref:hypothetical protein n=1 Tax=Novosphingobium sp. TaxID=1874826 RepID=UPI0035B4B57C